MYTNIRMHSPNNKSHSYEHEPQRFYAQIAIYTKISIFVKEHLLHVSLHITFSFQKLLEIAY